MARGRIEFSESNNSIKEIVASIRETAGPPHKPVFRLEMMLAEAFASTQADTHIITGSLRASGKTSSDFDGDEWTGVISYGGSLWGSPSPGPPNNPVDYAIFEQARGGAHDFMASADSVFTDEKISSAINEHFEG